MPPIKGKKEGYLAGFDASTQSVTVIFSTPEGEILGDGKVDIGLDKGENGEAEQRPSDWRVALFSAFKKAQREMHRDDPPSWGHGTIPDYKCLGICPSGQMHGEGIMLEKENAKFHDSVRLWCDSRNAAEAEELTELFGRCVPQRLLISRWLWTIRNRPDLAKSCVGLTTPSGVCATFLDPKAWGLGLGDACGAFPVNPETGAYYSDMARKFDELVKDYGVKPILELLAPPVMVGEAIGQVSSKFSKQLQLGVRPPIFSPEGDQPTTLAGSYTSEPGVACVSGGTSICHNLIMETPFNGLHPGVEPFMTVNGKPFLMCHIQNGTRFMNGQVRSHGDFATVMPMAAAAPVDCGGIITLPLAEPEHGLDFPSEAHSGIFNVTEDNCTPGNLVRSAFVGSMFGLLWSVRAMRGQNIMAKELVVSGGIVQSDWMAQAIADIFNTRVRVLGAAEKGSAYGAVLIAIYGWRQKNGSRETWPEFLERMRPSEGKVFEPVRENVAACHMMFNAYCRLVERVARELNDVPWVK